MALNVDRMHDFLQLDEKIKQYEEKIKDWKSEKTALEPDIVTDLVEAQMNGVVIGNRQLSVVPKDILNIHSKENLRLFLKENHPEFLKEDIDEKALQEALLITDEEEEGPVLPEEYDGLVSIFKLTKLKITKAKKS